MSFAEVSCGKLAAVGEKKARGSKRKSEALVKKEEATGHTLAKFKKLRLEQELLGGLVEVAKTDMIERDVAKRKTALLFSKPSDKPIFEDWMGYSLTYNKVPPGNGNALHLHNSMEIFVALDGPFEIGYGSNGEHSAVLQPMDIVACPGKVKHFYKSVGPSADAQIMTILPGRPTATFTPDVLARTGAECSDTGALKGGKGKGTEVLALKKPPKNATAPDASEKVFREGDMNPFVIKHAIKQQLVFSSPEGWIQLGTKDLKKGESVELTVSRNGSSNPNSPGDADLLVVVLRGTVQVSGPSLRDGLGKMEVFKMPRSWPRNGWTGTFTGTSDATMLIVRSDLPHHFNFDFHPSMGVSSIMGRLPSSLMQ